jgi:hypothetical protein
MARAVFAFNGGTPLLADTDVPVADKSYWVRLALGTGIAAALPLGLAVAFPQCLGGPYALLAAWIGSAGLAVAVIVAATIALFPNYAESLGGPGPEAKRTCLAPPAFAELAALPPARIMAPIEAARLAGRSEPARCDVQDLFGRAAVTSVKVSSSPSSARSFRVSLPAMIRCASRR